MQTARKMTVSDALELDVRDRIKLVEAIWDSIAEVPEAVELTDEQREELDRRLEAYSSDKAKGSPWTEVKARLLARK
jgi:putative addiction module component (TIGR02574 family)